MGERARAAAALGDRGRLHPEKEVGLPRALGKCHSSLLSSAGPLTLLLTMA